MSDRVRELDPQAREIYQMFTSSTDLEGLPFDVKERSDGDILVIRVVHPTERLQSLLAEANAVVPEDSLFPTRAILKPDVPRHRLQRPETELYLKVLSESLAVTKDSFRRGFFERYIYSVFGAEDQIITEANHIVFGRRGSGKSSLLLHTLSKREAAGLPNIWIELQVYQNRTDHGVITDVLWELLSQLRAVIGSHPGAVDMMDQLRQLSQAPKGPSLDEIRKILPDIKRLLALIGPQKESLFVFLDDLHVLPTDIQPYLLGCLNAVSRGNSVFLKMSSIESFTRTWDAATRDGLEVIHDLQVLKLDANLTKPQKARDHIEGILNAHAEYSGLPSARYLCNDAAVVSRLVWAAAGVPRDALNIFTQAITNAVVDGQDRVTVTNINSAASEAINDKMRDVQLDSSGFYDEAMRRLEEIRKMCVQERKTNAFLVEIKNDDPLYEAVRRLIDLRLLHVIHEGITVSRAGRKYIALILDYGFYVGLRAAKSVDLYEPTPGKGQYEALRALPILND